MPAGAPIASKAAARSAKAALSALPITAALLNGGAAPADAKAALREIIQRVERAYFGDHPADRTGYDACRRSFLALGSALGAGGRE